jgi:hypothetical protein
LESTSPLDLLLVLVPAWAPAVALVPAWALVAFEVSEVEESSALVLFHQMVF